ncbi:hypothetical protein GQ457_13G020270 [Hibiscus cannabinus]
MQLMSVDGLTTENVATHLHKYRLYLKRMQGLSGGCGDDTNGGSGGASADPFVCNFTGSTTLSSSWASITLFQVFEIKKSLANVAIHEESFGKLLTAYTPKLLSLRHCFGLWFAFLCRKGYARITTKEFAYRARLAMYKVSNTNEVAENDILVVMDQGINVGSDIMSPYLDYNPWIQCQAYAIQVSEIKKSPAHVAIHEEYYGKLLTTHTPKFLGLRYSSGLWSASSYGEGIIIGLIDTGVWPESASFNDKRDATNPSKIDGEISLAFDQRPYFKDVISIGSLSAYEKGIVVVSGTGNEGTYSISNVAPWILTVGSGTIDRSFIGTVTLENGLTFEGTSTFPHSVLITDASFYYIRGDFKKTTCQPGSLNRNESIEKVIFCDDYDGITMINDQLAELYKIRASAAIVVTDQIFNGALDNLAIPIMIISLSSGNLVREYVKGEPKPKVMYMRFVLTNLGTKPAPEVTSFSSRGPNPITPGILKPYVIAPGVDVLVAFPPIPKTRIGDYALVTDYALYSGTSMATPHVAGVAALLKASSNNWIPAAIRSALMTTAYTINNNGTTLTNQYYVSPATPLDYGDGHINPNKALDPGLIYDLDTQDYINFLCGLGYKEMEMRAVLRRNQWNCTQNETNFNYPSFVAVFKEEPNSPRVKNFSGVVTNVVNDQSIYHAVVENSTWLRVIVEPSTMTFTEKFQKQSFIVSVEIAGNALPKPTYGYLRWIDQRNRTVSSPIVALMDGSEEY